MFTIERPARELLEHGLLVDPERVGDQAVNIVERVMDLRRHAASAARCETRLCHVLIIGNPVPDPRPLLSKCNLLGIDPSGAE